MFNISSRVHELSQESSGNSQDGGLAGALTQIRLGGNQQPSKGTRKRRALQDYLSAGSGQDDEPVASEDLGSSDRITPADAQFRMDLDALARGEGKEITSPCQMTPRAKRARHVLQHQNSGTDDLQAWWKGQEGNSKDSGKRVQARSPPCHTNPFLGGGDDGEGTSLSAPEKWARTFSTAGASRFSEEFKDLGELGRGNYSKVFKVQGRLDGCQYAVKRSIRQLESNADRRRAAREVQALAVASEHHNVVRYFSSWVEASYLYIQLELCDEVLSGAVKAGRALQEAEVTEVIRQIGSALQSIHAKGMCHLDVKPDNIYRKGDMYKLGDFGLAARIDQRGGVEEGDARYLSQEVMQGNFANLEKADVFSLGASTLELGRGSPLPSNGGLWHQVRKGKFSLPGHSSHLFRLVGSLMHHDPNSRPSAEQAVRACSASKSPLPLSSQK